MLENGFGAQANVTWNHRARPVSRERPLVEPEQAITGEDDKAISEEVERGEDHIKAKYEEAVKEQGLQPATLPAIGQGYASVREGHDRMSALKHGQA